jgi:hypothetical protein
LALFVTAIPCIGWIMIIVWAFVGQNESRKNYYKAVIAWILIGMVFWTVMMGFGFWPLIQQKIELWIHTWREETSNMRHSTNEEGRMQNEEGEPYAERRLAVGFALDKLPGAPNAKPIANRRSAQAMKQLTGEFR